MDQPKFSQWTIGVFVDRLAEGSPFPGGGCAVALAGALTASLGALAVQINQKRRIEGEEEASLPGVLDKIKQQQITFIELMDTDALAYHEVVQAGRLPRRSGEERERRQEAIEAAFFQACQPPLQMAAVGLDLLKTVDRLASMGNPVVLADVAVMGFLVRAVVEGALVNIFANLKMVRPSSQVQALTDRARQIRNELAIIGPQVNRSIWQQVGEG
jgi:formiminotetrahydrofolate cyclodeaminase